MNNSIDIQEDVAVALSTGFDAAKNKQNFSDCGL